MPLRAVGVDDEARAKLTGSIGRPLRHTTSAYAAIITKYDTPIARCILFTPPNNFIFFYFCGFFFLLRDSFFFFLFFTSCSFFFFSLRAPFFYFVLLFSFVAFFSEGDPGLRIEKNLGNQNQKKKEKKK
jgi:hypothetical protein